MCKLDKKERIMKVAINLFITKGFHGTPTSLIAKEAEVANGTLFNYFKTKDVLINEIFLEVTKKRKEATMKGVEENWSLKEKLYKIWKNSLIWGIENKKEKKFFESCHESYLITEETHDEVKKDNEVILSLFEKLGSEKGLSKEESLMIFFNFIGAFIFTGKYFQLTGAKYDREMSKRAFERFFKGIELTDAD